MLKKMLIYLIFYKNNKKLIILKKLNFLTQNFYFKIFFCVRVIA